MILVDVVFAVLQCMLDMEVARKYQNGQYLWLTSLWAWQISVPFPKSMAVSTSIRFKQFWCRKPTIALVLLILNMLQAYVEGVVSGRCNAMTYQSLQMMRVVRSLAWWKSSSLPDIFFFVRNLWNETHGESTFYQNFRGCWDVVIQSYNSRHLLRAWCIRRVVCGVQTTLLVDFHYTPWMTCCMFHMYLHIAFVGGCWFRNVYCQFMYWCKYIVGLYTRDFEVSKRNGWNGVTCQCRVEAKESRSDFSRCWEWTIWPGRYAYSTVWWCK